MKSHRPSQIQASAVTIDALAMSNGVHSKEDLDQIRAASWGKAQAGRGIGTCTLLHDAGGVGNPGGRGGVQHGVAGASKSGFCGIHSVGENPRFTTAGYWNTLLARFI
jgi:hypothetical protein